MKVWIPAKYSASGLSVCNTGGSGCSAEPIPTRTRHRHRSSTNYDFLNMPVALSSYYKPSSSKAPTETVSSVKRTSFNFDPIEEALASFAAGEFLVVTDDENRENEGDLIISASQCTTEKMAWLIKHSRQVLSLLTLSISLTYDIVVMSA